MSTMSKAKIEQAEKERRATELFRDFVTRNREELRPAAHFGDGRCGEYARIMCAELLGPRLVLVATTKPKGKIPRAVAKQVFERDAYRCVRCDGFKDLCCDHIIPESKGGATSFDNLQTMCRRCNSRKGNRHE